MAETIALRSQLQSELVRYFSGMSCPSDKFISKTKVHCPPVFSNKITVHYSNTNPDNNEQIEKNYNKNTTIIIRVKH